MILPAWRCLCSLNLPYNSQSHLTALIIVIELQNETNKEKAKDIIWCWSCVTSVKNLQYEYFIQENIFQQNTFYLKGFKGLIFSRSRVKPLNTFYLWWHTSRHGKAVKALCCLEPVMNTTQWCCIWQAEVADSVSKEIIFPSEMMNSKMEDTQSAGPTRLRRESVWWCFVLNIVHVL